MARDLFRCRRCRKVTDVQEEGLNGEAVIIRIVDGELCYRHDLIPWGTRDPKRTRVVTPSQAARMDAAIDGLAEELRSRIDARGGVPVCGRGRI